MGELQCETGFVDAEGADRLLGTALSAVSQIRDGQFCLLRGDELMEVGCRLETLARVIYAGQVHVAGEVERQGMAAVQGASSTASLLRQEFNISAPDARGRVNAARQVLPAVSPTGDALPPKLPEVAAVLDAGEIGPEHVRTIVETMGKLPPKLPAESRAAAEELLVEHALTTDPTRFHVSARIIAEGLDPDGELDDRPSETKTELTIGSRSTSTGLTPIRAQLDDLGVEILRKAIDPLSAPKPEVNGVKDVRPAANRRAQALVEVLASSTGSSTTPHQRGQAAQVTVVVQWDALQEQLGSATFDSGHPASPALVRRLLCDAKVLPAVMGGDSKVLDVGRTQRTFPAHIRRAIALRDKGCIWPGCDRPPSWCEGHHIDWWQRDLGVTSYDNGVLLCSFHHGVVHRGEWLIRLAEDGIPELLPPKWIDPRQVPQRNTLHQPPPSRAVSDDRSSPPSRSMPPQDDDP